MKQSQNTTTQRTTQAKKYLVYIPMLASALTLSSCGHETVQEAKQDNISKIIDEITDNEEDIRNYEEKIRKLKEENRQLQKEKAEREAR